MPKGMNESLYSYTLLLHTFWDAISSNGGGFALLLFLLIDVKKLVFYSCIIIVCCSLFAILKLEACLFSSKVRLYMVNIY